MKPKASKKSLKKATEPQKKVDANVVIFDIDNVLIDTRKSYLDAIRSTVDLYLTHGPVPFFSSELKSKSRGILSPDDVEKFKLLGGFNDDWDCCYGLLVYLLSLPTKKRTVESLKKAIQIEKFSKNIKTRPLGVSGITAILGRPSTITIERVARIFQEIYLGKELFPRVTLNKIRYWNKRGLIQREELVFKRQTLEKLKSLGLKIGIATGRPYYEAMHALKTFGIADMFDAVVTMDEVKKEERERKESLRKPHPFSILKAAKSLGIKKKFLYVGDLPDDMLAAERAKKEITINSVGFPSLANNPFQAEKGLRAAKADFIIKTPSDLVSLLEK